MSELSDKDRDELLEIWASNCNILNSKCCDNNNNTHNDLLSLWKQQTIQWLLERGHSTEERNDSVLCEIIQQARQKCRGCVVRSESESNKESSFSLVSTFAASRTAFFDWNSLLKSNSDHSKGEGAQALLRVEFMEDLGQDWTEICAHLKQGLLPAEATDDDANDTHTIYLEIHEIWYDRMQKQQPLQQYQDKAMDLCRNVFEAAACLVLHQTDTTKQHHRLRLLVELWWFLWMDLFSACISISSITTLPVAQQFQDHAWFMVETIWNRIWKNHDQEPNPPLLPFLDLLVELDPCGDWFRVWLLHRQQQQQQQQQRGGNNGTSSSWSRQQQELLADWMDTATTTCSGRYPLILTAQWLLVHRPAQFPPWKNNELTRKQARVDLALKIHKQLEQFQNQPGRRPEGQEQEQGETSSQTLLLLLLRQGLQALQNHAQHQHRHQQHHDNDTEAEWIQMQRVLSMTAAPK